MTPEAVLRTALGGDWAVQPLAPDKPDCLVGSGSDGRVLLKLRPAPHGSARLSELGVTPRLLAAGETDSGSFAVHEFLDGFNPGAVWFDEHVDQLADLVSLYHYDQQLAALAPRWPSNGPIQDVLDDAVPRAMSAFRDDPRVLDRIDRFASQARTLDPPAAILPTHQDVHVDNFLVADGRLYLTDWEGWLLCDPISDVGVQLSWNVQRRRWDRFWDRYAHGAVFDERRVFWWGAKRSLDIAVWFKRAGRIAESNDQLAGFDAQVDGKEPPGKPQID